VPGCGRIGRVRLTMPWLDGQYTTGWARVVQAGAGKERGALILPEVGDEVLVGFTGADLDTAYVLGGLFNGRDTPPTPVSGDPIDSGSGQIGVRGLVSRTGHRLELAESANADGVLLSTGDGKFALRLDRKGQLVEVVSDGTVKVTARRGVSIDAGSGPLELAGRQVSVKATEDFTVAAATVKVDGQSSAEVTAGGTLTVRGGVVRIN